MFEVLPYAKEGFRMVGKTPYDKEGFRMVGKTPYEGMI